ncbi:cupin domain-containing protein [Candidatus Halobonum tyrrellensis]|uniref:Cupin 2 barrel domain-containing protein n=1 Tax=Candidatus Halobonum tyrrellensis G22 TaxID=1324957 RepID=V4HCR5_9EURY|nr:cupin domain-containing protein [Candidatus Halobonum tyrrellensis]ESP87828.1 Cupin 2 barrel domain-containing protein [Candidatus Halobonum tyrrellensis G22]
MEETENIETVRYDSADDVEAAPGVELAQLAAGEEMSVQHFAVDPGETIPEHEHHHEQAGYVLTGALTFIFPDGEEVTVEEGDSYVIPGGRPHGAENRNDERIEGIDVFSPPRLDADWAE